MLPLLWQMGHCVLKHLYFTILHFTQVCGLDQQKLYLKTIKTKSGSVKKTLTTSDSCLLCVSVAHRIYYDKETCFILSINILVEWVLR